MKSFFTTHPMMKVISLALAFLLWFVVREEKRIEMSVDVKVQVKNLPDRYVIAGELDPGINLRLVGPRTRMIRIDDAYFKPYELDLSGARRGINTFWVHEQNFKVPRGVQITRIVPQMIRLLIEDAEREEPRAPRKAPAPRGRRGLR